MIIPQWGTTRKRGKRARSDAYDSGDGYEANEPEYALGLYLREIDKSVSSARERIPVLETTIKELEGEIALYDLSDLDNSPKKLKDKKRMIARTKEELIESLIESNLNNVVNTARKYEYRGLLVGMSLLDLIQEGNLGLMRAGKKLDYNRRNKFTNYAFWWIIQAIQRAIDERGRTTRLPVNAEEGLRRLYKIKNYLEQRSGRDSTMEEAAAEMGIPSEKLEGILKLPHVRVSLERPDTKEDYLLLRNIKDGATPHEELVDKEFKKRTNGLLEILTSAEREIIEMLSKFCGDCTLEEYSEMADLSRWGATKREKRALGKISERAIIEEMHIYLEP